MISPQGTVSSRKRFMCCFFAVLSVIACISRGPFGAGGVRNHPNANTWKISGVALKVGVHLEKGRG